MDTKFGTIVCNKMLLNAENSRLTAFTVFELLRENQLGGHPHPPTPTLGLRWLNILKILKIFILRRNLSKETQCPRSTSELEWFQTFFLQELYWASSNILQKGTSLTLFRMGFFGAAHGCGGPKGCIHKYDSGFDDVSKISYSRPS